MKLIFLLEEFGVPSPGQQLLDRFLIGYARDGEFHRVQDCEVALCLIDSNDAGGKGPLQSRVRDFGLSLKTSEALESADWIVVAWKGGGAIANEDLLRKTLQTVRPGARCFVHGALANSAKSAKELSALAANRRVELCAGTSVAVSFRLPELEFPKRARLRRALIVVQGIFPQAELDGLEGLFPFLEERDGGEKGVGQIEFIDQPDIWKTAPGWPWTKSLLAAAISRSNTIQGDPVKDGRTQDIVGLRLLEKLAKNPRGWVLSHNDGVQSGVLVLDGALEDYNLAIELLDGSIFSTQLYRPPVPGQEQFSALAAHIENFLTTGQSPWPKPRSLLVSEIMGEFARRFKPESRI